MGKIGKKILSGILLFSFSNQIAFIGPAHAVQTDGSANNWTYEKAEHLAKRALIGATPTNIQSLYTAGSAQNAVDILFPSPSGPERSQYEKEVSDFKSQTGFSVSDSNWMYRWYQFRYYREPYEAKMKLFGLFEDIFPVDRTGNNADQIAYADVENHFDILWQESLGNYKTMVKRVLFDALKPEGSFAMGTYLNLLNQPDKNYPNENYARELMQLFLMLEYKPWEDAETPNAQRNYTEADVAALARVLTGFRAGADKKVTFDSTYHNTSTGITFLSGGLSAGDSFPFYNSASGTIDNTKIILPINGNNGLGDNTLDYIFSKRKNEIAYFVGWRMYKYYIEDKPTQQEIQMVGDKLLENNFDIYPTVKWLLSSDLMYSQKAMNTLRYKNPVELAIGTLKLMHYKDPTFINPIILDTGLLSNLDFVPYNPRSIFGRPGFDNNLTFMNAYFHNQWMSLYANRLPFEMKNGKYNFTLNDFLGNTRINETALLPVQTSTGNTFSGKVLLSQGKLLLKEELIIGTQTISQENTSVSSSAQSASGETSSGVTSSGSSQTSSGETLLQNTSTSSGELTSSGTQETSGVLSSTGETASGNTLSTTGETLNTTGTSLPTSIITQNITTKELPFVSGEFSLTGAFITTAEGYKISFTGSLDFSTKKLNISDANFVYSGSQIAVIGGTADISSDSTLERDMTPAEFIAILEKELLLGKKLPDSVKTSITNYLLQDEKSSVRKFLPNNATYKDKYMRMVVSIMFSQPEFLLQSGWDQENTDTSNGSGSPIQNKKSKLILVELFGGYDWMHAMIPKTDYDYYTSIRKEMALSGSDLIDVGDYYMNKAYAPFVPYLQSGNLKIFNRVGAPNHSRGHDTAQIQMTSQTALQTVGTPGLIGELIKNESDPLNNVVFGTNKPTIYTNGNYINIGGNALNYRMNYGSFSTNEKTYNLGVVKNILQSRNYPSIASSTFKNSVTLDTVASSGQTNAGYTLASKLNFTKSMMNNGLGITYYVPGGGGYDTHDSQQKDGTYNLTSRTTDLAKDITNFFSGAVASGDDVTMVMYSEFGRTLKANGTLGTDHGQGGGYFVLTSNNALKQSFSEKNIYGKLNPKYDIDDWFGVGIDYRAIFSKVLQSLYGVDVGSYFGKNYELSDYLNQDLPKPVLLRNEYRNSWGNNVNVDIKFDFDDTNMLMRDGSYIRFYRGTDPNKLTEENRWVMENYFLQKDGKMVLTTNLNKGTKYYYKLEITDNQYDRYTTTGSFIVPDKITDVNKNTISYTSDTYFSKYADTLVQGEKNIDKVVLFNSGTGTNLSKTFSGGIVMTFGSGETSVDSITSDIERKWNGGFVLPKEINKEEFLSKKANISGDLLSGYKIEKVLQVGSDVLGVGMKLNRKVALGVGISDSSKNYSVITSQDGINWKKHDAPVIKQNNTLTFATDHFSYFALIETAPIGCSIEVNPKKIELGKSLKITWSATNSTSGSINQAIGGVMSSGEKIFTPTQTGSVSFVFDASNSLSTTNCTASADVIDVKKEVSPIGEILPTQSFSSGTTVGSGYQLIGETIPEKIFSYSGESIKDFAATRIPKADGTDGVELLIDPSSQLFTSTGNLVFQRKTIPDTQATVGNLKYSFSGSITLGTTDTILLSKPATIRYFQAGNYDKFAYKKSQTSLWNVKSISQNPCTPHISNQPVCAFKSGNDIVIVTYHFTDFSLVGVEDTSLPPPVVPTTPTKSSGGGGSGGINKDVCPTGDFSPSYYDRTCGEKTVTNGTPGMQNNSSGTLLPNNPNTETTSSPYKYALVKASYKSYDVYVIGNTDYSKKTIALAIKIIDHKKYSQQKKAQMITALNAFIIARYNYEKNPQNNFSVKTYNKKAMDLLMILR